jgi:hypothetical protein
MSRCIVVTPEFIKVVIRDAERLFLAFKNVLFALFKTARSVSLFGESLSA